MAPPGSHGGSGQHQMRHGEFATHLRGMRGHGCRERVGGVDDGVDAFVVQPIP